MSKRFELINLLNAHDKFRDNEQCVEFDSFEAERTLNLYYELLNNQDQRIAELEEQLKNAIVPKFKVGQKVWIIDNEKDVQECEIYELKLNRYVRKLVYNISYNIGLEDWTDDVAFEDELFATREEALAKLKELKGE